MSAAIPLPEVDDLTRPYWDALAQGNLAFQKCEDCGNVWLPARDACARCLSPKVTWTNSAGRGRIMSWVIYHIAYHEAFKNKLPYSVTLVELDEGPRLLTNIVNVTDGMPLKLNARVALAVEKEGDLYLPRFRMEAR